MRLYRSTKGAVHAATSNHSPISMTLCGHSPKGWLRVGVRHGQEAEQVTCRFCLIALRDAA